jgi:arylsulfatase A-like enzyme
MQILSTRNLRFRALIVFAICLSFLGSLTACREEATTSPATKSESPSRTSPNLVIITLDTTRADALGAYGQSLETSPNFDRMAREGTLFEDVMTSSPETLPAHATIFTGKFPFAHGVRGNAGYVLSDEHLTLAEALNAAGYETRAEVAAVVVRKDTQLTQGFSTVRDTKSEGVHLKAVLREREGKVKAELVMVRDGSDITDSGIQFVKQHQHEKFFLWLHYFDAHAPYTAPPPFNREISESDYHAEVAYQDFQMGRFIENLEQLGLRDNTLVVVTADHGEGLLEHGERTHSYFLYNTTVRVPLIFWGIPDVSGGKRVKTLVRNADIAPTVLDLLGLYPLDDIAGVTLAPLISETGQSLDLVAYGEANRVASTFNTSPLRFVREGQWKYIHKVNPELYDLESDPEEQRNQIDVEPEIAARLHGKLEEILDAAPAKNAASVGEMTHRVEMELRALGYVAAAGSAGLASEGESLEVFGDDPAAKTHDMELEAFAVGAIIAKKYEESLEWAEPLWRRNPNSSLATNLLSESYAGVGRWSDAIPLIRKGLEFNPENFVLRERMVTALAAEGRNQEAIAELLKLNLDRACNAETLGMLNQFLHADRRFEEQRDVIGIATADCPGILANLNNYAWILATVPDAGLRDGAKAIGLIRQAIASLGTRDPAFLDTLAAGLAEQGRFREAVQIEMEVIEQLREAGASTEALIDVQRHLDSYRSELPVRDPPV